MKRMKSNSLKSQTVMVSCVLCVLFSLSGVQPVGANSPAKEKPVKVFILSGQSNAACFSELGWTSLSRLSEHDRELIFAELFEPGKGANFSVCRMPMAANDFSRDWYSYNETDGDSNMSGFSIHLLIHLTDECDIA